MKSERVFTTDDENLIISIFENYRGTYLTNNISAVSTYGARVKFEKLIDADFHTFLQRGDSEYMFFIHKINTFTDRVEPKIHGVTYK